MSTPTWLRPTKPLPSRTRDSLTTSHCSHSLSAHHSSNVWNIQEGQLKCDQRGRTVYRFPHMDGSMFATLDSHTGVAVVSPGCDKWVNQDFSAGLGQRWTKFRNVPKMEEGSPGDVCTNWCLSVRYDVNHESATPVIPMSARRSRSSGWEMVSNAALRLRRMSMVRGPESAARTRSLVILTRAVLLLCFWRKLD